MENVDLLRSAIQAGDLSRVQQLLDSRPEWLVGVQTLARLIRFHCSHFPYRSTMRTVPYPCVPFHREMKISLTSSVTWEQGPLLHMTIESGHTSVVEWLVGRHPSLVDQLVGNSLL